MNERYYCVRNVADPDEDIGLFRRAYRPCNKPATHHFADGSKDGHMCDEHVRELRGTDIEVTPLSEFVP